MQDLAERSEVGYACRMYSTRPLAEGEPPKAEVRRPDFLPELLFAGLRKVNPGARTARRPSSFLNDGQTPVSACCEVTSGRFAPPSVPTRTRIASKRFAFCRACVLAPHGAETKITNGTQTPPFRQPSAFHPAFRTSYQRAQLAASALRTSFSESVGCEGKARRGVGDERCFQRSRLAKFAILPVKI